MGRCSACRAAVLLGALLLVLPWRTDAIAPAPAPAAARGDPRPPGEPGAPPVGGRTLWQLGEGGVLKLAGASPPVAPQPRFWTFNTNCRPGVCSALCWERSRHYDEGRCFDASSGRRYCKCWRRGGEQQGAAAAA